MHSVISLVYIQSHARSYNMELIRLAGQYRLKEKIVSEPSHTYGAIVHHSHFTHRTG